MPCRPRRSSTPRRLLSDSLGTIAVSGDLVIKLAVILDGLFPERAAKGASIQIVADLPNGGIEPLLWLYRYRESYRHPFLFRRSVDIPSGTVIEAFPRTRSC